MVASGTTGIHLSSVPLEIHESLCLIVDYLWQAPYTDDTSSVECMLSVKCPCLTSHQEPLYVEATLKLAEVTNSHEYSLTPKLFSLGLERWRSG